MIKKLNPMEEYEKEFQKQLKENNFPNEKIIPNFYKFLDISLNSLSIADMNCDKETYLAIIKNQKQGKENVEFVWDLMTISYVINSFCRVSPEKYGVDIETYLGLQQEFEKMAADWNAIINEIKTKVGEIVSKRLDELEKKPNLSVASRSFKGKRVKKHRNG